MSQIKLHMFSYIYLVTLIATCQHSSGKAFIALPPFRSTLGTVCAVLLTFNRLFSPARQFMPHKLLPRP